MPFKCHYHIFLIAIAPTYKSRFTLLHFILFFDIAKDDKTPHCSLHHSLTTST